MKLSSFNAVFTSGNPLIKPRVDSLCDDPQLILKHLQKDQKLPSMWCTKWSANFILAVTALMEEDQEIVRKTSTSSSTRKSNRTQNVSSLPAAANALVTMVNEAKDLRFRKKV